MSMCFILHNKHDVHTCTSYECMQSYDCMHACSPMIACMHAPYDCMQRRRTRFSRMQTHTNIDANVRNYNASFNLM